MIQPAIVLVAVTCLVTIARAAPTAIEATWPSGGGSIDGVAFSPDGKQLASIGDSTLKLWSVADHKEVGSLADLINTDNRVRFSPDGNIVYAIGKNDTLARLAADTGKAMEPIALKSTGGSIAAFDISPDSRSIVVVGRSSLRILSATDGAEQQSWVVHENYGIKAVAFSPDGKFVATAATDKKSLLIEVATGKIVWEMPLPMNGTAVCFAPDGKTLYVGDSGGSLVSFDLASGEGKTLLDQKVTIGSLAITPDGKALFLGGTNRQPWKVSLPGGEANDKPLATQGSNTAMSVSPDGKRVAGGWMDGSLCLWMLDN